MIFLDYQQYAAKIRQTVAESVVLLRNEKMALPILPHERVAVFGRAQIDTYYCGTGSGGMVNIPYLVSIAKGLQAKREIDEDLLEKYEVFVKEHPFDKGKGWAQEPFSQEEMPLCEADVQKAGKTCDIAVFVVGRSAGEDKDSEPCEGSFYLSETERENLALVCQVFKRVAVVLNVGGLVDLSFVNTLCPAAVLYAFHGGIESGNGYADVLCGDVNPSGSLPNTVAYCLNDYPSSKNFGGETENIYAEDIFVGYRYFETFAKDAVQYPFGFGLSYTNFALETVTLQKENARLLFSVCVKNTGDKSGKKAVQVYAKAPQGRLGKASRVLCGFAKTRTLKPGETQTLCVEVQFLDFASFNEKTSAFVLEKGDYHFYVGFDVREAKRAGGFSLEEDECLKSCTPALLPHKPFLKMTAKEDGDEVQLHYENARLRGDDFVQKRAQAALKNANKTNFGYTFDDVMLGVISAEMLANDLSDDELICLSRGEGMCSPKVTPGTAGTFGGVSAALKEQRNLPLVCCADGPSGLRMDCGTMALSIPNATAIAATFNTELSEELFGFLCAEMLYHKIDMLLGPGMNIHRHPLCGRNFEYYSEDPFLSGKMATAQIQTMSRFGLTGVIKHFAANNQEKARKTVNALVSARAMREIYLKGFEMAVKGGAYAVMTAYNPINGTQAASNYELNTMVLREDWGFEGVVMTDWWATMNKEDGKASEQNTADMICAQNDVFMVCANSESNSSGDNSKEALQSGALTRAQLVRGACNILTAIQESACANGFEEVELRNLPENSRKHIKNLGEFTLEKELSLNCEELDTSKSSANCFVLYQKEPGRYAIEFDLCAEAPPLAQLPLTVKINGAIAKVITLKGGQSGVFREEFEVFATIHTYVELFFGDSGLRVRSCVIRKTGER